MGEDPPHKSPVSVLFLRSSALMLLVFDHWNKENEMISGLPVLRGSSEVNSLLRSALGEQHPSSFP